MLRAIMSRICGERLRLVISIVVFLEFSLAWFDHASLHSLALNEQSCCLRYSRRFTGCSFLEVYLGYYRLVNICMAFILLQLWSRPLTWHHFILTLIISLVLFLVRLSWFQVRFKGYKTLAVWLWFLIWVVGEFNNKYRVDILSGTFCWGINKCHAA